MVAARNPAVEAARDALPQGLAVTAGQLLAVGLLDAVVTLVTGQSDRTARQFALRIDAFVALDEPVNHAHVPVQQRIAPERLPFGEVHFAGKDVHGRMVANRIVDAAFDPLFTPHAVHHAREPPVGTQVGGVARIDQPVTAGMFLAETFGVGLEEDSQQFCQRVGLFPERLERIEPRRCEVESGLVAENRGR